MSESRLRSEAIDDADSAESMCLLQRLLGLRPHWACAMTCLARVDTSQRPIAQALRDARLPIAYLHQLGGGVPDMLTQHVDGHLVLIEAKSPGARTKPKTKALQDAFSRLWPVHRCETIEDALRAVGVLK